MHDSYRAINFQKMTFKSEIKNTEQERQRVIEKHHAALCLSKNVKKHVAFLLSSLMLHPSAVPCIYPVRSGSKVYMLAIFFTKGFGGAAGRSSAACIIHLSFFSAGGNNHPENGLVKPPRRDTRALQPSRYIQRKCAIPLSGAEEQAARAISAHAQCAFLFPCK
jgi:hypothetical protein